MNQPAFTARNKRLLICGALLLVFAQLYILYSLRKPKINSDSYAQAAPELNARIQAQIAIIAKETLAQSFDNLADTSMFFWPGSPISTVVPAVLPFDKRIGNTDVNLVLSNRRFLRILDDVAALPKDRATAMMQEQLIESWAACKVAYAREFDGLANLLDAAAPNTNIVFPSAPANSNATPSTRGCQLKMLALLLIVGNEGLVGCKGTVEQVTNEARQKYQTICQQDKINKSNAFTLLAGATNYNRQMLGTAMVGVQPLELCKILKADKSMWQTSDLTKYNARATAFDLACRTGIVPVDMTFGKVTVKYLKPLDDDAFEALLAKMK